MAVDFLAVDFVGACVFLAVAFVARGPVDFVSLRFFGAVGLATLPAGFTLATTDFSFVTLLLTGFEASLTLATPLSEVLILATLLFVADVLWVGLVTKGFTGFSAFLGRTGVLRLVAAALATGEFADTDADAVLRREVAAVVDCVAACFGAAGSTDFTCFFDFGVPLRAEVVAVIAALNKVFSEVNDYG